MSTIDEASIYKLCAKIDATLQVHTENFERWMEAHGHARAPAPGDMRKLQEGETSVGVAAAIAYDERDEQAGWTIRGSRNYWRDAALHLEATRGALTAARATIAEQEGRIGALEAGVESGVSKLNDALQWAFGDADWRRRVDVERARLFALLSPAPTDKEG